MRKLAVPSLFLALITLIGAPSATKASDHNLYIRGNTMYQSNYLAGLRVVDISHVTNPKEIGHFDTVPWGENSAP